MAKIPTSACPTYTNIFTTCSLLENSAGAVISSSPVSPATSFNSFSFLFPTTTVFFAIDFSYTCNTNCGSC
jgi:hypothetical protein